MSKFLARSLSVSPSIFLPGSFGFQELGKRAAGIAFHFQIKGNFFGRQIGKIGAVQFFCKTPFCNFRHEEGFRLRAEAFQKIHNFAQRDPVGDRCIAESALWIRNDLKAINDHMGHESGDKAIREACRAICVCFAHSPVYRIGGDEFTVILEGADYTNRDALLESLENQMAENVQQGKTAIAFGCSLFNPLQDKTMKDVFDRADDIMYHRKAMMKHL